VGALAHRGADQLAVQAHELGLLRPVDEGPGGLQVEGGDAEDVVRDGALGRMDGQDTGVAEIAGPLAVALESLGVLDGDVGGSDGGHAGGRGDQGDAGFGQIGGAVRSGGEARQEVLFAEDDGADPLRGGDHLAQVQKGLRQFDEQVDGKMAFGQAEFLFLVGQQPVEGLDLVGGRDHGQDVAGEVGAGRELDVLDHGRHIVHAVAPDHDLHARRKWARQHGVDGEAAVGPVLGDDAVLEVEDDRPGLFRQDRSVVVDLVEVEVPNVQRSGLGNGPHDGLLRLGGRAPGVAVGIGRRGGGGMDHGGAIGQDSAPDLVSHCPAQDDLRHPGR